MYRNLCFEQNKENYIKKLSNTIMENSNFAALKMSVYCMGVFS